MCCASRCACVCMRYRYVVLDACNGSQWNSEDTQWVGNKQIYENIKEYVYIDMPLSRRRPRRGCLSSTNICIYIYILLCAWDTMFSKTKAHEDPLYRATQRKHIPPHFKENARFQTGGEKRMPSIYLLSSARESAHPSACAPPCASFPPTQTRRSWIL